MYILMNRREQLNSKSRKVVQQALVNAEEAAYESVAGD
jgi:hypothetical protein